LFIWQSSFAPLIGGNLTIRVSEVEVPLDAMGDPALHLLAIGVASFSM
jgi:hypothetical protein